MNNHEKVSKYAAVWNKIKTAGKCEVVAEKRFHKTIVKAVKKRKNLDVAFRFLMDEAETTTRLIHSIDGNKIEFFLKKYTKISIGDL